MSNFRVNKSKFRDTLQNNNKKKIMYLALILFRNHLTLTAVFSQKIDNNPSIPTANHIYSIFSAYQMHRKLYIFPAFVFFFY